MPHILHIDTATDKGTVAITFDGSLLAHRINEESRNHAGTVNIMINQVLEDASLSMAQLSAVAVCAGPGSYTGLRIAVATAKGLCYALDKPLMLHNRLSLLAYHPFIQTETAASQYISLLYAREKEYFISTYDQDFFCTLQPQHITEKQLFEICEKKENSFMVTDVTDGIIKALGLINLQIDSNTQVNLFAWARYAFLSYQCNDFANLTSAEPFYLKQVFTHK